MSETFLRIRRGARGAALGRSVALGLAAGAAAAGALLLISKLWLPMGAGLPWAAGAVAGLAVFAVALLLLWKNDRRLARHLDETYGLHETVQTMLAFRDREGELLQLQREQAEGALRALPPPPSPIKRFWRSGLALMLAVALLLGGVLLPAKGAGEPPVTDTPFAVSAFQLGALRQLIDEVKIAPMTLSAREETVAALEDLLARLPSFTTQYQMKTEVIATVVSVDLIIENANSFKRLALALDGGKHADAKTIAAALLPLSGIGFGEALTPLREHYRGAETATLAAALASDLAASLTKAKEAAPTLAEDELYLALSQFAADMAAVAADTSGNENTVAALADKAFAEASDDVGRAISVQYTNKTTGLRVIEKLPEIFGIPAEELPALLINALPTLSTENTESDEQDKEENAGGYGEGNELFGSNDTIYHPFGEKGAGYVSYGEAYGYYYPAVEELLNYGGLGEATKNKIIAYFARLSDGTAN